MNFVRLKSKLLSRHLVSSDNQPTAIKVKKGTNPYFAAPRIESPSPRRLHVARGSGETGVGLLTKVLFVSEICS